jgi:Beta-galactosidase/beta-glucuronidase
MRSMKINRDWDFGLGQVDLGKRLRGIFGDRKVNLPHDYMIESDVYADVPSGPASGYYNAGVAHYAKEIKIPADWENDQIFLRLDGAMMNATVEVNGSLACLQHYGYAPFETDITRLVYPGQMNRVVITLNPSMQPNSRWFSGAGLFRGVELVHTPKLHVAFGGLSGYTKKIEYKADGAPETAYLQVCAEIKNENAESRLAEVTFALIDDKTGAAVKTSKTLTQVQPMSVGTASMTLTVDDPMLWDAEHPNLYRLQATVKDAGTFKTHIVPNEHPTEDTESALFGIRTVEADVKHGLRINGKSVKLKGGCLHHDNGPIGAVTVYDAEARKVKKLKEVGFNAIRTTHNPPSSALIEACDRLGMYIFDEAFDAWGMGKQPGDYNQYFETDWEKDLTAFVKRDRCHPCVTLWSTGNEITERGGLNDGYVWAAKLADTIRRLDPSRPISNGICSFWNGLDDIIMAEQMKKRMEGLSGGLQNADIGGKKDLLWEQYTEGFANGLDVVGYNYLEGKYEQDHQMFPERVILGSENYPKEIGMHWPMIEKTPWVIGDFTWTAWDYIGEAGIGKATFYEPSDPNIGNPWGAPSPFPWRTANDADFDVTGQIRPQGVYRHIVWGSRETGLFSYDPAVIGKVETLSSWGFPGVWKRWNWQGQEGKPVDIAVFSSAEEVELFVNGVSVGRKKAGEALIHDMPLTFLFRAEYQPGTVEAVSYTDGKEVSRTVLKTVGKPVSIRLAAETEAMKANGESLCYVNAELIDENGNVVPNADRLLKAEVTGAVQLLGFGSGNPITDENYSKGQFTSYQGKALAVLRAGYEAGKAKLTVSAEDLGQAEICLQIK